jgi:peptidoglycan hydrolase-like protein with peptidoglycan-binding domain
MVPAPERYQEIQQALASRGYLKPEDSSGVWGQTSIDALKRFQREQNLQATGRIDSLSLIALGLGPRHDTAEAKPPPPLVITGQSPAEDR